MEKEDRSLWIILAGIALFSLWYTLSKRTENALWLVLAAICFLILAYRLYGAFVATRAAVLSEQEIADSPGRLPTPTWVAFGYQFASIAGVGVLVGPLLAAQFGYLPGYLWALLAAVLAGGVHDLVVLAASARRRGAFLPLLINEEMGPWAGLAAWGIVVIALLAFLAITGSYAADLLTGNVWAIYTVTVTVIVALLASTYEAWLRPGRTGEAAALAIVLAAVAMVVGSRLAMQTADQGLLASRSFVLLLIAAYCLASAVLPLRFLGRPRGAVSGYLAVGGVIFMAAGIAFGAPFLRQTATTQYTAGNGPLISGGMWPYLLIVVTSGAVSGLNALVSTGVTSRLLQREVNALPVGFGAMLVQSLLVVLILVSVSTLYRWDFYAMTSSAHLNEMEKIAGAGQREWDNMRNILQTDRYRVPGGATAAPQVENSRTPGGATALSASVAWLYRDFPGVKREWLPTLYRFMFVLQGLILLAAVEAGMRAGRVAVEEAGKVALRSPLLVRYGGMPGASQVVTVGGAAALTLLWLVLAARADVLRAFNFLGFIALLLACIGLGAGVASLRAKGRWYTALVALPMVVAIVLALVAGAVNIRDSSRFLGRGNALMQAYAELPSWGSRFKFVNLDRAREVVRQWPAAEQAKLYMEKGQTEVAKQLQGRFSISEADAKTLAGALGSRASGLTLWSWLQIVLTLLLFVLALGVAVGRFVRVPLRWPARAPAARPPATPPVAPVPAQPAPELPQPGSGPDFEI